MTTSELLRESVARLISAGIPPDDARVEARVLLTFALGLTIEALRMHPNQTLTESEQISVTALFDRRMRREPLAYIVGSREFYGLRFRVTPDALIPRPETEFLVETILQFLKTNSTGRVVDVGTGSGCIAISVASRAPEARIFATDISPDALAIARENAAANGVAERVQFAQGDLLAPINDDGPFDVIASNPPYVSPVAIESLEPEVRDWEPRIALGIDADDLHFYRRLATKGPFLLAAGGLLAVEVGAGQAELVMGLWIAAGLMDVGAVADYAGVLRVVVGRRRFT